jgi:hypothetical protein
MHLLPIGNPSDVVSICSQAGHRSCRLGMMWLTCHNLCHRRFVSHFGCVSVPITVSLASLSLVNSAGL